MYECSLHAYPNQWHRLWQLRRRWIGAKIIPAAECELVCQLEWSWRLPPQNQRMMQ
ncbi:hypothetical protein BDA96_01G542000 [Sorghum bicolor]|uniref:Uncharacterized protein n=1 Tax=Sorghum bicolor TaxID=4558 RepID=A0A921V490_SORBI|nr:hypothetical protein BDA96_01G542000 [Sorghum bicolor]